MPPLARCVVFKCIVHVFRRCVRVCLWVVAVVGTGWSDWKGRSGRVGRATVASHSAQPAWGGRGGGRRRIAQRKCSMGLHNTRGERDATRRRQPQGLGEWPLPAPPPPLRLQPPAPPQGADTKADRCGPAGTANVLRGAPTPSVRSGAEWVECSHWCCPSAPSAAPGHLPAPPPPTGAAAESSSPRVATRSGARDGCSDGAVRRRTGGDDEGEGSGRGDPTQESGPVSALGSRAPSEAHVHPWLIPMAVSCCSCSCPTFLVCPAAPVRLLLSAPPPLSNAPPLPAPPPRPPCAEGMDPAAARHRCGKLEGMGNEQLRGKRRGRRFLDRRLDSWSALCRSRAARAAPALSPPRPLCPPRLAHLNLDRNTRSTRIQ